MWAICPTSVPSLRAVKRFLSPEPVTPTNRKRVPSGDHGVNMTLFTTWTKPSDHSC